MLPLLQTVVDFIGLYFSSDNSETYSMLLILITGTIRFKCIPDTIIVIEHQAIESIVP